MEPDLDLSQPKLLVKLIINQINVKVTEPQNDATGGYTTYLVSGND